MAGKFVFSFDFELYWGVHHNKTYTDYKANLDAASQNLLKVSKLFVKYNARFTCASVGMLYNKSWQEFSNNFPSHLPTYTNLAMSPYSKWKKIKTEVDNKVLFSTEVLNELYQDGQEMATHTYSHYFCFEKGNSIKSFEADIEKALEIGAKCGHELRSIVFPRNQYTDQHLKVCFSKGIKAFRGNPSSGFYSKSKNRLDGFYKRLSRLADSYLNVTGSNTFDPEKDENGMLDIKASFFLRPLSSIKSSLLKRLHLRRVKNAMTSSAKNGKVFHLWCHPHNVKTNEDLECFIEILKHFKDLNEKYKYQSMRMADFIESL